MRARTRDTTSLLLCPAGLCIMIAASIYTSQFHVNDAEGGYGHSYVLAWISFVFSLLLAITYLVLRKKSEWETTCNGGGWGRGGAGSSFVLGFQFEFFGARKTGVRWQFGRNRMLARAICWYFEYFKLKFELCVFSMKSLSELAGRVTKYWFGGCSL